MANPRKAPPPGKAPRPTKQRRLMLIKFISRGLLVTIKDGKKLITSRATTKLDSSVSKLPENTRWLLEDGRIATINNIVSIPQLDSPKPSSVPGHLGVYNVKGPPGLPSYLQWKPGTDPEGEYKRLKKAGKL
jgi:hypothetical protein